MDCLDLWVLSTCTSKFLPQIISWTNLEITFSKNWISSWNGNLKTCLTKTGFQMVKYCISLYNNCNHAKQCPILFDICYEQTIDKWNLITVFRHMIRHTLQKNGLSHAKVRIPLNISSIPIHQLNQPPWLVWWPQ